jgi:thioredoxin 1
MTPIFHELEQELGEDYTFAKLNVDEARDISIEYGITSVPTFLFIKNDEVKGKETGYMAKEDLLAKIEEYLG